MYDNEQWCLYDNGTSSGRPCKFIRYVGYDKAKVLFQTGGPSDHEVEEIVPLHKLYTKDKDEPVNPYKQTVTYNLFELLKNKKPGCKLYSPAIGIVILESVTTNEIICSDKEKKYIFDSEGHMRLDDGIFSEDIFLYPDVEMSWGKYDKKADVNNNYANEMFNENKEG